uniref:Uncharacterized protein n=1 Tax=Rhizophora mucronata TaxID=61149 RepID=A0A2P2P7K1_RHIMU
MVYQLVKESFTLL